MKTNTSVLIVGGGPVGLLVALRLGQAGIDTLVIEGHHSVLPATRAMVYMPIVIPALTKLGIIEDVKDIAFLNQEGVAWRDLDGQLLARLPFSSSEPDAFGGVLLLGQYKMSLLIMEELKKYPCVEVQFSCKCGGIEDDPTAEKAKVLVHSRNFDEPDRIIHASYVVGADGANSTVRRLMCVTFDGFTYSDWKMIGTDVVYDYIKEEGFSPLNFVCHPDHWAVIAYSGQDEGMLPQGSGQPQWRVAYTEPSNLPGDSADYIERAHERLKLYHKGSGNYKLLRAEPYINHQRCASQARKGRVILAGDALHSNNPIGGLGLTGGICDAFCYGNALVRILKHGENDSLLTQCADSRRQTWITTTNQLSQSNIERLYRFDEQGIKARNGFFDKLKMDEAFPGVVRGGMAKMMVDTFE